MSNTVRKYGLGILETGLQRLSSNYSKLSSNYSTSSSSRSFSTSSDSIVSKGYEKSPRLIDPFQKKVVYFHTPNRPSSFSAISDTSFAKLLKALGYKDEECVDVYGSTDKPGKYKEVELQKGDKLYAVSSHDFSSSPKGRESAFWMTEKEFESFDNRTSYVSSEQDAIDNTGRLDRDADLSRDRIGLPYNNTAKFVVVAQMTKNCIAAETQTGAAKSLVFKLDLKNQKEDGDFLGEHQYHAGGMQLTPPVGSTSFLGVLSEDSLNKLRTDSMERHFL